MVIKKIKMLGVFFLICIFSGCGHTLKFNGKRYFMISDKNTEIRVTAKSNMGTYYTLTIKCRKGYIEIHPNKLKLTSAPVADTIKLYGTYYKNKAITQSFMLSPGEKVNCKFSVYPNLEWRLMSVNEIYILPGDFITQQGVSLINDTIKMKVYPQ